MYYDRSKQKKAHKLSHSDDENMEVVPSAAQPSKYSSNLIRVNYSRQDLLTYGVLCLLFAGLFATLTYSTLYTYPWQSHWGTTTGVVTSVVHNAKSQKVEFSYSAGNQNNITGRERFTWHGMFLTKGNTVTVRYDPSFVERSVIQTGPTVATFGWLICVLFAVASAIGCFFQSPGPAVAMKVKLY